MYLLVYFLLSYGIYILWKKITGRELELNLFHFFVYFLYKVSLSLWIIGALLGVFFAYHNDINPATAPLYTLSNGEQIVEFQTMSHLASQEFYNDVVLNIFRAKKRDFILFYEGVAPGSEENQARFNEALGIDFSPGLYEELSKLYGMVPQDNNAFL